MVIEYLHELLHSLRLTGKEKRVGNFDLMWHDGPVAADDVIEADCVPSPGYPTNSFLGMFRC